MILNKIFHLVNYPIHIWNFLLSKRNIFLKIILCRIFVLASNLYLNRINLSAYIKCLNATCATHIINNNLYRNTYENMISSTLIFKIIEIFSNYVSNIKIRIDAKNVIKFKIIYYSFLHLHQFNQFLWIFQVFLDTFL